MFGTKAAGEMLEGIEKKESADLAWATAEKERTRDEHKSMIYEGLAIGTAGLGAAVFAARGMKNNSGSNSGERRVS